MANQIGIAIVNWEMRFRSRWENRRVFLVWECLFRSFLVWGVFPFMVRGMPFLEFWIRCSVWCNWVSAFVQRVWVKVKFGFVMECRVFRAL